MRTGLGVIRDAELMQMGGAAVQDKQGTFPCPGGSKGASQQLDPHRGALLGIVVIEQLAAQVVIVQPQGTLHTALLYCCT